MKAKAFLPFKDVWLNFIKMYLQLAFGTNSILLSDLWSKEAVAIRFGLFGGMVLETHYIKSGILV